MKRAYVFLLAMTLILQTGYLFANKGHDHGAAGDQTAAAEKHEAMKYVCPMHTDVQSDKPGECPKCGMTLKQAAHEETPGEDSHKGHHHKH